MAAVLVAVHHYWPNDFGAPLYLMVDLFFVLSGWVISARYGNQLHSRSDLVAFLVRRIARLVPLLLASTLLWLLVTDTGVAVKHWMIGRLGESYFREPAEYFMPSAGEIAATLTLTHALGLFDHEILNAPSWSISAEFYTYLMFALVALGTCAGHRRSLAHAALAATGLCLAAWGSLLGHDCASAGNCLSVTYDFGLFRCVGSFFIGALLAQAASHRAGPDRPVQRSAGPWQVLSLTLAALVLAGSISRPEIAFLAPPVFGWLLWHLRSDCGLAARVLRRSSPQHLGRISYSTYLLHAPLLPLFTPIRDRVDSATVLTVVGVAYLGATLIIAALSYRFLERPARDAINERFTAWVACNAPATKR